MQDREFHDAPLVATSGTPDRDVSGEGANVTGFEAHSLVFVLIHLARACRAVAAASQERPQDLRVLFIENYSNLPVDSIKS
jgi:hypothetical protein